MKAIERPERRLGAVEIEIGDRLDRAGHVDRHDHIFADAAADQPAIELDIIGMADDHNLGAGVADLGEMIEFGDQAVAGLARFDHDEVRRRRLAIEGAGGRETAHLHLDMGAGHPPVGGGELHHRGEIGRFAEDLDRDARDRPDIDQRGRLGCGDRIGKTGVTREADHQFPPMPETMSTFSSPLYSPPVFLPCW